MSLLGEKYANCDEDWSHYYEARKDRDMAEYDMPYVRAVTDDNQAFWGVVESLMTREQTNLFSPASLDALGDIITSMFKRPGFVEVCFCPEPNTIDIVLSDADDGTLVLFSASARDVFMAAAATATDWYDDRTPADISAFLRSIADEIDAAAKVEC